MLVTRIIIEVHDTDRIDVGVAGQDRVADERYLWSKVVSADQALDMVRKRLPGAQVDEETGERY